MTRNRVRSLKQEFYISEKEAQFLKMKMKEAGIRNKSAYLRKMALDGYIIRKDYTELKSMVTAVNRIGNNLNQMTSMMDNIGCITGICGFPRRTNRSRYGVSARRSNRRLPPRTRCRPTFPQKSCKASSAHPPIPALCSTRRCGGQRRIRTTRKRNFKRSAVTVSG